MRVWFGALLLCGALGCGGDDCTWAPDGGARRDAAPDAAAIASDGGTPSCASPSAPRCYVDFFSCFDAVGMCVSDPSSMNMKVCWPNGARSYSTTTSANMTMTTLFDSHDRPCATGRGEIVGSTATQTYTRPGVGELVLRAFTTNYEITCPDGTVHAIEYDDLNCTGSSSQCTIGTCL